MRSNLIKKMTFSATLLLILSLSNVSMAQNIENGKVLYAQCISCHGENGEGNPAQKAPKLSGQHDWYTVKQIKEIKAGIRKNEVMMPFVTKLSEQDILDLAAYIKTL